MKNFDSIITSALKDDMPIGDITTAATVPEGTFATGRFIAKAEGVVCGIDIARKTFRITKELTSCGEAEFKAFFEDGDTVRPGDIIAEIKGDAQCILMGERTALNLMQRAGGIATAARCAVEAVKGTKAKITDTRKTMPGLWLLDKYAVRVGGAVNHRFNLSDGILIKDNHIAAAGGITNAVKAARAYAPHTLKIEVETESMEQVGEALTAGADIIMLDNMSIELMKEAVEFIAGRAITEASGGMGSGDKDLRKVAETGVDLISMGSLTHSVTALDVSLKIVVN